MNKKADGDTPIFESIYHLIDDFIVDLEKRVDNLMHYDINIIDSELKGKLILIKKQLSNKLLYFSKNNKSELGLLIKYLREINRLVEELRKYGKKHLNTYLSDKSLNFDS